MRTLLIEDDEFKRVGIESALRSCQKNVYVHPAGSLYDAILALDEPPFDLVVLDMAIPSHPPMPGEGAPISFLTGGLDVLLELDARGRNDPCIVITQFPEVEVSGEFYPVRGAARAIRELLGYDVISCIAYSSDSEAWMTEFKKILDENGYSDS